MSRNGYEMDDESRDPTTPEREAASSESSPEPPELQSRPRKSRAPKAKAAGAASSGGPKGDAKPRARKSVAPRARRTSTAPKGKTSVSIELAADALSPDLISIPPADLDEHDERFFAEGETVARGEHAKPSARVKAGQAHSSDLAEHALVPVVPLAHRQKLANYVKVAVGFSVVVCIAAFVRVGISKADHGAPSRSAATSPIVQAPIAPVAQAEPPAAPEVAPAPAIPLKSATEEREDARNALEHGKPTDAIEAAARSVKVDPTDAEAWLLLGAANQEAGHSADAHAAFVSCTKEAKTGNVGECGALLSWNGPH